MWLKQAYKRKCLNRYGYIFVKVCFNEAFREMTAFTTSAWTTKGIACYFKMLNTRRYYNSACFIIL